MRILLLPVLCWGWLHSQCQSTKDLLLNRPALDSIVLTQLPEQPGPGLAVIISQGNQEPYTAAFGLANLEHQIPFTGNTISDLGSVAKQFTAFAIALLVEEGKLNLDTPISSFFPKAPDFGITVRQMIHHTSGIREVYDLKSLAGMPREGISQFEAQEVLNNSIDVNFEPGTSYAYCNTAYMLLADIVEHVSGQGFEAFMRDKIFNPLNMHDTYIMDIQGEIFPMRADSYRSDTKHGWVQVYDVSSAYGQGGMYASLWDMKKWMDNLKNRTLGSDNTHELFRTPGKFKDGTTSDYAFGIRVQQWRNVNRLLHSGASAGYRAYVAYYPDFDLQIMLKGNWSGLSVSVLGDKLAAIVLQSQLSVPDPDQMLPVMEKQKPVFSHLSKQKSEQYIGSFYSKELNITYLVERKEDALCLRKGSLSYHEMRSEEEDVFLVPGIGRIHFIREKNGEINGFQINTSRVKRLQFFRTNP